MWPNLYKNEDGMEFIEWALMAALFALIVAVAIPTITGGLEAFYNRMASQLSQLPAH